MAGGTNDSNANNGWDVQCEDNNDEWESSKNPKGGSSWNEEKDNATNDDNGWNTSKVEDNNNTGYSDSHYKRENNSSSYNRNSRNPDNHNNNESRTSGYNRNRDYDNRDNNRSDYRSRNNGDDNNRTYGHDQDNNGYRNRQGGYNSNRGPRNDDNIEQNGNYGYNKHQNQQGDYNGRRSYKNDGYENNYGDKADNRESRNNYSGENNRDYNNRRERNNDESYDRPSNNKYRSNDNYGEERNSNFENRQGNQRFSSNNNEEERPRPAMTYEPPKSGWASDKRRYEWDENQEEGARDEKLEEELFGDEMNLQKGINFKEYMDIPVKVIGDVQIKPIKSFSDAKINKNVMQNIKLANYETPTPVQMYTIPIVLQGLDLMACAQTGSGKTASFMIPIFSHLMDNLNNISRARNTGIEGDTYGARRFQAAPLVLVIAPTRELTMQIFDECRRFTYRTQLRPCVIYGGASPFAQSDQLRKGCDILIATPGRLNDFVQRGKVKLDKIKFLVIDEADRMLDMGFSAQLNQICKSGLSSSKDRQTMMFSATFPKQIRMLATKYMKKYTFLAVGRVGGTTSNITQEIIHVDERDKLEKLLEILTTQKPCRTLIFVETKRGCDTLDDYLFGKGLPTTSIHGDRTQAEREDALLAFKLNKTPILIATAVAERGLDIKDVMHVINYDLSKTKIDEYVHRIGRTGRAGNKGKATSFFNDYCLDIAPDLAKLLVESKQKVPDFLQEYVPNSLEFEEVKDNEYQEDFQQYIDSNEQQQDEYNQNGRNDSYGNRDYNNQDRTNNSRFENNDYKHNNSQTDPPNDSTEWANNDTVENDGWDVKQNDEENEANGW